MSVNDKASTTEDLPPMDTSSAYPDKLYELSKNGKISDEERAHLIGQWKDSIDDSGIRNINNSFDTVTLEREKGVPEFPGRDESEQTPHEGFMYDSDIGYIDIDNKSDIITSELPKIPPSEDYMGERGKLEFLWHLQTEEQLPSQAIDFL